MAVTDILANSRYRATTILAFVIIITVMFTSIWHLPQPWAIEILKNITLGAVGVLLVNTASPNNTTPK